MGHIHGIFAFNLGTTTVDRSARQTHVVEEIIHKVDLVLGVDENQGTDRQHAHDQIVQSLLLGAVLDKEKLKYSQYPVMNWSKRVLTCWATLI